MSACRRSAVVPLAVALLLTGCGLTIPTDPDGTLDRVRSSEVLRVGAGDPDRFQALVG